MAIRLESATLASTERESRLAGLGNPWRPNLRLLLILSDIVAITAAWLWVFSGLGVNPGSTRSQLPALGVVLLVSLAILAGTQLYLARVCHVRVIEVSLLGRASFATALLIHLAESPLGLDSSIQRSIGAAGAMWAALCITRGLYAGWLRRRRARGHNTRPIVIVGQRDDGLALSRLLAENPEYGLRTATVLEPESDLLQALAEHQSDSVLLVNGAWSADEQRRIVKRLHDVGVHVHYSTGFSGIDHRRLRAQPIAREPLFYVERITVSPWQLVAKRVVDVIGSVAGLVVSIPLMFVAAIAIKLDGGGPVLYRQERIGLGGRPFRVYKLRTMVRNAETQLHLVRADNERTGPLYKSRRDPRVTRVGRILRATSLDELPQLFNVLQGTMSLVGPRPALAVEVAQFDLELQDRTRVKPGVTGLWQTEARDNPSFDAYRRLDLFYLDNWTLELDFVILLATARSVMIKAICDLRQQRKSSRHPKLVDLSRGPRISTEQIDLAMLGPCASEQNGVVR